jgi:hypothetical protein
MTPVIAQQIARTAVPNYQHRFPEIPEMLALGRNAPIILANQLVINDRLRPDRYIVKDITGLRGPDLRDSRQPRPAAHGEVLFDSYWGGKANACSHPIPTPNGWKLFGDLHVGDQVFDDLGHPCNVTGVYPQPSGRPCREVVFSDGTIIIADADHLWETVDFEARIRRQRVHQPRVSNRRKLATSRYRGVCREGDRWLAYYGPARSHIPIGLFDSETEAAVASAQHKIQMLEKSGCGSAKIHTTEEIRATLYTSHAPSRPNGVVNHAVRVAGPLQYVVKELPLAPYTFGAWLGDGSRWSPEIYSADPEVIENVSHDGYATRKLKGPITYSFRSIEGPSVPSILRDLDVYRNKHIPRLYLEASVEQRRALLAGLLDTDGTVGDKGEVQFDSTLEHLALQVLELARSLGYRPTLTSKWARLYEKCTGISYRVQFVTEDSPFRLSRKTDLLLYRRSKIRYPEHEQYRYITAVNQIDSVPMRCISVDSPSHLYLIGESMIPTHNTVTIAGTMEAGSVPELNAMERDLVAVLGSPPTIGLVSSQTAAALAVFAALQSLTEFPIKFNWWDQHDAFFDSQSVAFWSQLSGQSLSIPGNGRCTSFSGGATVSYHNLRGGFVDEVVTASVALQPTATVQSIGVISAATASNSYLQAVLQYTGATWQVAIQAIQPSGTTTLATAALSPQISTPSIIWVQMQTIDDTVVATVYLQDPHAVQSPTVLATCFTTLTGALAQAFGYKQSGFVGLTATQLGGQWAFLDWRVDAIMPCDFVLNARTVQSPAISHISQNATGTRFTRDFQFAVRASDPRILCPVQVSAIVPLLTGSGVYFGRSYPRSYPLTYNVPTSLPSNQPLTQSAGPTQQAVATNKGTWVARPLVTINGGITNPVLYNLSTGFSFALDGTIAQGDFVQIDAFNHTLTNKSGASVMQMFDTNNQRWPEIQPADNILQLAGSNPIGSPSATVAWNSAWI